MTLSLLAAGCTGDHAARDHVRSAASATPSVAPGAVVSAARRATSPAGFASLPDRGELMAYVPGQQAVRRSAYTWHPVRLSEAHALNAIVDGELVVRAPDGRAIHLRYERHVEHADGNWTWIGREAGAAPGSEAILTFGEKAVFGSIPNGTGLPYRLTSAAGSAWLVETDRNRLARTVNAATRPEAPDFLLPPRIEGLAPRLAAGAGSQTGLSTGATPAVGALTASGTTVDLLLGYTAAFATRLGGQSQAMTRLNYIVDVTNVAYANSQIDAQVNLVRAVQVNYADATPNVDALYDLTGVECTEQTGGGLSCEYVGVPESLQPLHTARDQYGADLVSLVRNFSDPENDGCGLAWINGGGQLPITVDDEITGLSVIGDSNGTGPDAFPDNGYICRDETLAHELGHNMGSAHDRDTADGDDNVLQSNEYGRYPYSFGYKSVAGGFYTVMAYGDSGQVPYRVFSNPAINCGGNPCGVADSADNARSLRQTIPIIAQFRMAIRDPVANDFDGDGRADIFWRSNSGGNVIWRSGNASSQLSVAALATSWAVKGVADFNGDGVSDVFWRNDVGNNIIWKSANASTRQYVSSVSLAWTAAGVGDFNGDGRSDILWRNAAGNNIVWLSANASTKQYVSTVGTHWSIAGIGDFNGDGRSDILWRNTAGNNIIWLSANALTKQYVSSLGTHWNVVGVGDFNGDGRSDILWRNSSGNNAAWLSANATTQQYVSSVGTYWSVAGVEDFDGDGRSDILWRNTGGGNIIWLGANAGQQQYVSSVGTHWSVVSGKVRW